MKLLALFTVASGLTAAAPVVEPIAVRAATSVISSISSPKTAATTTATAAAATAPLLVINVDDSSSPLLAVNVGSGTLLAVGNPSETSSTTITVTTKPSSATYPTVFPSTFSAPIQGQGILSLKNLPALPGVIDKSFSGLLGSAYGLMSGSCNLEYKCSITVAGSITSLLVDGDQYTASSSITGWCDKGHCYGSIDIPLTATAPFDITCDHLSGTSACSATISGAASAIFENGEQIELWGWITPAGSCQGGVCTASIQAFGDPMY